MSVYIVFWCQFLLLKIFLFLLVFRHNILDVSLNEYSFIANSGFFRCLWLLFTAYYGGHMHCLRGPRLLSILALLFGGYQW